MIKCAYCHKPVRWWEPLTAWAAETIYCPHCGGALRIDRSRYSLLTGAATAAIVTATGISTSHPYLLITAVGLIAAAVFLVFGKVVRADSVDG